jgi:hypothetical protein
MTAAIGVKTRKSASSLAEDVAQLRWAGFCTHVPGGGLRLNEGRAATA